MEHLHGNFVLEADGENGRQAARDEEQMLQQEDEEEQWLIFSTTMLLILHVLTYTHLVWVAFDVLLMAASGKSSLQLPNAVRIYHMAAMLIQPASTTLLYYIYNGLEQQAFEDFEEMFPPDQDGMGDAKRSIAPDTGRSPIFWAHSQRCYRTSQFWLFALQLPLLLVILHDLNQGLGYLGSCYACTEYRAIKFAAIVLVAIVNRHYCIFPLSFIITLITDFYGQILPFTQLYPRHPTPYFWGRLALGVLVLSWWRLRLRKVPRPFVPNASTAYRLILGHIGQDVDMLLLGQLALLGRWMRLTGQAQRRLNNDIGQIQLVDPAANHNELVD